MPDEQYIGLPMQEIDTPALVIDLEVMEDNISRMAGYFKGIDANLRPHIKTHKCPIIAHKQLAAGASGITCSKLGEAEVMIQAGIKDILIANEIVGTRKIRRLMDLARQADLTVAVDDAGNIEDLQRRPEWPGSN
jgi:D-serine deaminase-like pyridoxal phosphate-dependent protein